MTTFGIKGISNPAEINQAYCKSKPPFKIIKGIQKLGKLILKDFKIDRVNSDEDGSIFWPILTF